MIIINNNINTPILSSEKLLSIIDKAQIIIFIWKNAENWPVEYVSENISLLGYTPDEFLSGKLIYSEIIYPNDLKQVNNEVKYYSENHSTEFQQEYRILTKEGETKWIHDRTTIRYDSQGNATHYEGIIIDITEKKRNEQKLQELKEKYQELVSQAGSFIVRIDANGVIAYANEFAVDFFGFSEKELVGQHVIDTIVPPVDSTNRDLRTMIDNIFSKPDDFGLNINENIKKDGERVWCSWANKKIYNAKGEYDGLLSVGNDITALRNTQIALKRSEEKYQKFFQNVSDGILVSEIDENGRPSYFIEVNKAACDLLNYSREELLHLKPVDINVTFESADVNSILEELMQGKKVFSKRRYITKDKREIPVELNMQIFESFGKRFILINVRDITERKNVETRLKASMEKYQQLFENVSDAILVSKVDENGDLSCFTEMNKAACDLLNYSREELLHLKPQDIDNQYENIRASPVIEELRQGRKVVKERRFISKDKQEIPVELSIQLFDFLDNQFVLTIARDITERKQAEAELKASMEKYQQLFENVSDAIYVHGIDENGELTNFIEVNRAACELLNYSREELLHLKPEDINGTFESVDLHSIIEEIRIGKKVIIERVHVSKNKREIPVELSIQMFDLLDQPLILTLARDITERKKAELKLKESMEKYQQLFENVSDAIYVHEINENGELTCFTEANKAACSMLNYSREEFLHLKPYDLGGSKYSPEQILAIVKRIRLGRKMVYEAVHISKDKRRIPIEQSTQMFEYLDKQIVLTIARDITERKKAETELKASSEKYQQLFENVSDAVYVHKIDANEVPSYCLEVNNAACKMLNYSREEFLHLKPQDLDGNYENLDVHSILREIQAGKDVIFEGTHISKLNKEIPVEVRSKLIEYKGSPAMISLVSDITERKQLEKMAEDRYREALELSDLKSNIILWVFTELKSPLNSMFFQCLEYKDMVVTGQEQILVEKTRLNSTIDQLSQIIKQVDEFITISRLESVSLDLHKEEIEILPLIKSVLGKLGPISNKKNLAITVSGNSALVELDKMRIEHVLLTLILQMIDITKEYSSISITLSDSVEEVAGFLRITLHSANLTSYSSLVSYNHSFIKICDSIIQKHNGILIIEPLEQQQAFLIEILLPMPGINET